MLPMARPIRSSIRGLPADNDFDCGLKQESVMAGRVDAISNGFIAGWVFDPERPDARLAVKVMVGDKCLCSQEASRFRTDLAAAGYGDGKFAFDFELSQNDWLLLREHRNVVGIVASHQDTGATIALPLSGPAEAFLKRPRVHTGFLTETTPNVQLAAVCIIKDEARYVEEWVAYHLARGVQYFVFYDNGSTDDLAGVLAPYVRRGIARIIPWPNFVDDPEVRKRAWHEQNAAYAHAFRTLSGVSSWIIVIDVDEFVATTADHSIPALLAHLPGDDLVTLYWRFFGSSGYEKTQPGLVIETFTHRKADGDIQGTPYKFVARPEKVGAILNTHTPVMVADEAVGAGISGKRFWTVAEARNLVDFSTIWINHYHVKSREEYLAKVVRGWPENTSTKNFNWPAFFKMHDNNEVDDPSIARYGAQVRQIMAGMGSPPAHPGPAPVQHRDLVTRITIQARGDRVAISGLALDLSRPGERVRLRIEDMFGKVLAEELCALADKSGQTNGLGDGKYCYASTVARADLPYDQVRIRLNEVLFCRTVHDPARPKGEVA
jgi:hypothetical protein